MGYRLRNTKSPEYGAVGLAGFEPHNTGLVSRLARDSANYDSQQAKPSPGDQNPPSSAMRILTTLSGRLSGVASIVWVAMYTPREAMRRVYMNDPQYGRVRTIFEVALYATGKVGQVGSENAMPQNTTTPVVDDNVASA